MCTGEKVAGSFHGTGDIFSSVCVGALANGCSLGEAVAKAVRFTCECIRLTVCENEDRRFGVDFEKALYRLTQDAGDHEN